MTRNFLTMPFVLSKVYRRGVAQGTNQKNPRVRKIRVRNSGAGNGSPNCMDTWKKCVLSPGKAHVHKIPRFGGGGILGLGGGPYRR